MASLPGSTGLLRALIAASCLLPIIGACGGRSDTQDYLFDSDGNISVGASSSSAGRGSTAGGTRSTGGSNGTGARGTITGGSGSIGGATGISGSGPITGGIGFGGIGVAGSGFGGISMGGVGVAGNAAAGVGGNPVVNPISCGQETCDGSTQVCCAGLGGFGCLAKNKTCNGAVLSCTTTNDCPANQVCCVALTGDVANASSCKDRCDNMGTGRDRQLCDVDADCSGLFRFCTATIFGINICTRRP
jgi:hypothetical protein